MIEEPGENPSGEFILYLLHSVTNAHLLHLRSNSYAEHVALGDFYSELSDLADELAEVLQGAAERQLEFPTEYFPPADTGLMDIQDLRSYVSQERTRLPQESHIQNIIDEIAALIDRTIYKLKFLK